MKHPFFTAICLLCATLVFDNASQARGHHERSHHARFHRERSRRRRDPSWRWPRTDDDSALLALDGPDTPDERDANGRLKRSKVAIRLFKQMNPCPSTGLSSGPCPGYVIDHIIPLKRGGADNPDNMQWQTEEDAKAKDAVE